jgi:hypothetical protein
MQVVNNVWQKIKLVVNTVSKYPYASPTRKPWTNEKENVNSQYHLVNIIQNVRLNEI